MFKGSGQDGDGEQRLVRRRCRLLIEGDTAR
jgi:hypothetical protein